MMSICWYHSIYNKICEWATLFFVCLKGWLIHLKIWPKQFRPSSLNYQLEVGKVDRIGKVRKIGKVGKVWKVANIGKVWK